MRKVILAVGLLAAVSLAAPAPARAHFSIAIGLPGFAFFAPVPPPPPVVYAPPVYYYPPAYYPPAPVVYYGRPYRGHGHHYGWWKHGGYRYRHADWDDD